MQSEWGALHKVYECALGSDPFFSSDAQSLITTFLQACKVTAPPPRHNEETFDVNIIISHLASLGPNNTLTLKDLRCKAIVLLAISLMARSSDLARVWRNNGMKQLPDGSLQVRLLLPKEWRAQGVHSEGLWSKWMVVPPHSDPLRCPVRAVVDYVTATTAHAPQDQSLHLLSSSSAPQKHKKQDLAPHTLSDCCLFISLTRPFKSIGEEAIANVIKRELAAAGINADEFTAHSIRSASASAALDDGASVPHIMARGRWASVGTFMKFYAKTVKRARDQHQQ